MHYPIWPLPGKLIWSFCQHWGLAPSGCQLAKLFNPREGFTTASLCHPMLCVPAGRWLLFRLVSLSSSCWVSWGHVGSMPWSTEWRGGALCCHLQWIASDFNVLGRLHAICHITINSNDIYVCMKSKKSKGWGLFTAYPWRHFCTKLNPATFLTQIHQNLNTV